MICDIGFEETWYYFGSSWSMEKVDNWKVDTCTRY